MHPHATFLTILHPAHLPQSSASSRSNKALDEASTAFDPTMWQRWHLLATSFLISPCTRRQTQAHTKAWKQTYFWPRNAQTQTANWLSPVAAATSVVVVVAVELAVLGKSVFFIIAVITMVRIMTRKTVKTVKKPVSDWLRSTYDLNLECSSQRKTNWFLCVKIMSLSSNDFQLTESCQSIRRRIQKKK